MHNPKNADPLLLLILITLLFCVGASPQTQPPKQGNLPQSTRETDKVIVYYFHIKYRCGPCKTIERYTRESVEASFAKELKSGQIAFQSINVDVPENRHYMKDYKLYTQSVIVSDRVQGKEQRWKNLQKVWELFHNEKDFKAYIKRETDAYLREKRS